MNAADTPQEPYSSARDLPTFREMEQNIRGMQELINVAPVVKQAELKRDLKDLSAESNRIALLVDAFYEKLGSRNWIFSSDLSLETVESIVEKDDTDDVEKALITYYRSDDHVKFWLKRLARFEAMKPRLPLLRSAFEDYKCGRHYSVVLVLIAVMDGFVNDLDKQTRKGLHARSVEEMFAWNSIVGHHMGLTNAHKTFTKSCKKTVTKEVRDLYRHGIMHGMVTNFDNSFASTKAWNHLFAIGDWADAKLKEAEQASAPPEPSIEEVVQQYRQMQEAKARRDQFEPYECTPATSVCDVLRAAEDYFLRWDRKQWGLLGPHFMQPSNSHLSDGNNALDAKRLYEEYSLDEYTIRRIEHFGSMRAHVRASLTVNGQTQSVKQRWLHVDDASNMVDEWADGRWVLAPYGPLTFIETEL
ncbi:hypothetical protein [Brevibacterium sp. 1718]|uniref:hypothetical protein n=1 Tax=Brevibacterium sp. 1718 TaxID=3413510 RepID=UPI003DA8B63A